ncbi:hypothetical protein D3C72_2143480 [compost metagenome]
MNSFSDAWASIKLTSLLLTTKSSARVTSASSRLRTSVISLTTLMCRPAPSAILRMCRRVIRVRVSADCIVMSSL